MYCLTPIEQDLLFLQYIYFQKKTNTHLLLSNLTLWRIVLDLGTFENNMTWVRFWPLLDLDYITLSCCHNKNQQFKHECITLQFCRSDLQTPSVKIKVLLRLSSFPEVLGVDPFLSPARVQFLVVVGPRCPFPCGLKLRATHSFQRQLHFLTHGCLSPASKPATQSRVPTADPLSLPHPLLRIPGIWWGPPT